MYVGAGRHFVLLACQGLRHGHCYMREAKTQANWEVLRVYGGHQAGLVGRCHLQNNNASPLADARPFWCKWCAIYTSLNVGHFLRRGWLFSRFSQHLAIANYPIRQELHLVTEVVFASITMANETSTPTRSPTKGHPGLLKDLTRWVAGSGTGRRGGRGDHCSWLMNGGARVRGAASPCNAPVWQQRYGCLAYYSSVIALLASHQPTKQPTYVPGVSTMHAYLHIWWCPCRFRSSTLQ